MQIIKILTLLTLLPCLYGEYKQKQTTKQKTTTTTPANIHNINKNKKLLQMVEKKFMSFMGLSEKPEKGLKQRIKVPEHLWKLYYKWSDENFEDYTKNNADTARIVYHDVEKDHVMRSILSRLRFNLTGIDSKEKLQRAELHLFHHGRKSFLKKPKLLKVLINKDRNEEKEIVSATKLHRNKLGYVKLDVTKAVEKSIKNSINPSLDLHLDDGEDDNRSLNTLHLRQKRDTTDAEWHQKRPLLVLYTASEDPVKLRESREHSRKRRSMFQHRTKNLKRLNETHQRSRREMCRLRKYFLQFSAVGWNDWILAPTGYDINYCSGECPRPLGPHFNTTNHAVIQNTVLSIKRGIVPPLCCVPTTLKDQTFLYLDSEGKLVLRQPVQMVALGCGCR